MEINSFPILSRFLFGAILSRTLLINPTLPLSPHSPPCLLFTFLLFNFFSRLVLQRHILGIPDGVFDYVDEGGDGPIPGRGAVDLDHSDLAFAPPAWLARAVVEVQPLASVEVCDIRL